MTDEDYTGIDLNPDKFKTRSESAKAFNDLIKNAGSNKWLTDVPSASNVYIDTQEGKIEVDPYTYALLGGRWETPSLINYADDTKPTIQDELSKIYEEIANLRKMLNEERKGSLKKDEQVNRLIKEKEQLEKKLIKSKKRTKTYSALLKKQEVKLVELETSHHDMRVEIEDLKDKIKFKEENR